MRIYSLEHSEKTARGMREKRNEGQREFILSSGFHSRKGEREGENERNVHRTSHVMQHERVGPTEKRRERENCFHHRNSFILNPSRGRMICISVGE